MEIVGDNMWVDFTEQLNFSGPFRPLALAPDRIDRRAGFKSRSVRLRRATPDRPAVVEPRSP